MKNQKTIPAKITKKDILHKNITYVYFLTNDTRLALDITNGEKSEVSIFRKKLKKFIKKPL